MDPIVDAHHHLWDLRTGKYKALMLDGPHEHPVIGSLVALRRNYLLEHFKRDWDGLNIVKSVHVQADYDFSDPVGETRWLQALADEPASGGFPQGIVGYADLTAEDLPAVMEEHLSHRNFRGIRQSLAFHPLGTLPGIGFTMNRRDHLMDDAQWRRGFALLVKHGLSFDMNVNPRQFQEVVRLARDFPDANIVLIHCGLPADHSLEGRAFWREGIRAIAAQPNVSVKLSALGVWAPHFTADTVRPFILDLIDAFGPDRSFFGSDFPVEACHISYRGMWDTYSVVTLGFSREERRALFHDTACRVYRI